MMSFNPDPVTGNFLGDFTQVHQPRGDPTVAVVGNKIVGL